jgi:hypothetical protein
MGTGPIERRLRELGGVKALVVGAFAVHSADVHTPVDGLPRTSHHYLVGPSKAKGAAKALLYAAPASKALLYAAPASKAQLYAAIEDAQARHPRHQSQSLDYRSTKD